MNKKTFRKRKVIHWVLHNEKTNQYAQFSWSGESLDGVDWVDDIEDASFVWEDDMKTLQQRKIFVAPNEKWLKIEETISCRFVE